MKFCKYITSLGLIISCACLVGCKEKGCTDPSATNYNIGAKKDDSSCEYANTDIFSGSYTFSMMVNGAIESFDTNKFQNHFFYALKDSTFFDSTLWIEHTANFKNFNNGNSSLIISFYTAPASLNPDTPTLSDENIKVGTMQIADLFTPLDLDNKISISRITNGKTYSTLYGRQQAGNFNILKRETAVENGANGYKIHTQFNVTLYNQSNLQETISITNGEALIFFKN